MSSVIITMFIHSFSHFLQLLYPNLDRGESGAYMRSTEYKVAKLSVEKLMKASNNQ